MPDGTCFWGNIPPTTNEKINILSGSNYYSAIHTHPLDTYPMFSWSDVYNLYILKQNIQPHNQGLASFLLVCQDDASVFQTYAIVFNQSLVNTIDNIFSSPENQGCSELEIVTEMNDKIEKNFIKEEKNGTKNYERAFLRTILGYNVSMYKANADLNNWSQLSLDNLTGTTVNSIPCK